MNKKIKMAEKIKESLPQFCNALIDATQDFFTANFNDEEDMEYVLNLSINAYIGSLIILLKEISKCDINNEKDSVVAFITKLRKYMEDSSIGHIDLRNIQ